MVPSSTHSRAVAFRILVDDNQLDFRTLSNFRKIHLEALDPANDRRGSQEKLVWSIRARTEEPPIPPSAG